MVWMLDPIWMGLPSWNHSIFMDPSPMGSTLQSKWAGWPSMTCTSLMLLTNLGGFSSN